MPSRWRQRTANRRPSCTFLCRDAYPQTWPIYLNPLALRTGWAATLSLFSSPAYGTPCHPIVPGLTSRFRFARLTIRLPSDSPGTDLHRYRQGLPGLPHRLSHPPEPDAWPARNGFLRATVPASCLPQIPGVHGNAPGPPRHLRTGSLPAGPDADRIANHENHAVQTGWSGFSRYFAPARQKFHAYCATTQHYVQLQRSPDEMRHPPRPPAPDPWLCKLQPEHQSAAATSPCQRRWHARQHNGRPALLAHAGTPAGRNGIHHARPAALATGR